MALWPAFDRQGRRFTVAVALATVACLGCSGGTQFGRVSGRVRLDGRPLAGATVEFQPTSGSPSYGLTDATGYYTLAWTAEQSGALTGEHTVRITSFRESRPDEPERLPPRYHRQSELTREVKRGSQRLDFDLTSK
jgi:hypothetical protein